MLVIEARSPGGPEVLNAVERPIPTPSPGEILLRQDAVGLNFIDAYHRSGRYPVAFPAVLGTEGAGVVEAVGEGVTRFKQGDRAAYAGPMGAYAQYRTLSEDKAVRLPTGVSSDIAAAGLLKGLTAYMLLFPVGDVKAGDTVLVHAAAGGVGSLLTQWAKALGADVIATVGDDAKAQRAADLGADHVIMYDREDVAARVRDLTAGAGVRAAFDGVGRTTFDASLASLSKRGHMICYGAASGAPEPVDVLRLMRGGSLSLTRPALFDFTDTPEALDEAAAALFSVIAMGQVRVDIGQTFPLALAAQAHRAIEGRATVGSTILIP